MQDFVPRRDSQLVIWLENLSQKLSSYGKPLGLSATEVTSAQTICTDIVAAIKHDEQVRQQWLGAVEATQAQKGSGLPALRTLIARMKVAPGWNATMAKEMAVVRAGSPTPQPAAMDSAKPRISVDTVAGRVQIKFVRRPFEGLNVYTRKKGEGTWRFVARATKSPFVDPTPIAIANSAEVREYYALGVRKDVEVGQPSDIVVIPLRD